MLLLVNVEKHQEVLGKIVADLVGVLIYFGDFTTVLLLILRFLNITMAILRQCFFFFVFS